VIIRRLTSTQYLITQPAHAALAARIVRHWQPRHFPDSPRKASILHAIDQHDNGWTEVDETLVVDQATGQLLDFMELPDALKRHTALTGLDRLAADAYAAALVAQHRVHVYRRYAGHPEWRAFFGTVQAARDSYLGATRRWSLADLLRDYTFVRAGDLASLAFCNGWAETADDGCGYSMRLDGSTLTLTPDPFDGRTIDIEIEAHEIGRGSFASAANARTAVANAPVVTLRGQVKGGRALTPDRFENHPEAR
jgi:hypothetical protein